MVSWIFRNKNSEYSGLFMLIITVFPKLRGNPQFCEARSFNVPSGHRENVGRADGLPGSLGVVHAASHSRGLH